MSRDIVAFPFPADIREVWSGRLCFSVSCRTCCRTFDVKCARLRSRGGTLAQIFLQWRCLPKERGRKGRALKRRFSRLTEKGNQRAYFRSDFTRSNKNAHRGYHHVGTDALMAEPLFLLSFHRHCCRQCALCVLCQFFQRRRRQTAAGGTK